MVEWRSSASANTSAGVEPLARRNLMRINPMSGTTSINVVGVPRRSRSVDFYIMTFTDRDATCDVFQFSECVMIHFPECPHVCWYKNQDRQNIAALKYHVLVKCCRCDNKHWWCMLH